MTLAETDKSDTKERAVELYALAGSHPFIAKGQLFEDVAGRKIKVAATSLPPEVMRAAQARGRMRDWWETASALLTELRIRVEF